MPKYSILITKTVQKQLDNLPEKTVINLINCIEKLADNPRPSGYKKLKNRNGYRIRKGDYRIIYDIFDHTLIIEIIVIGHRKDIYDMK